MKLDKDVLEAVKIEVVCCLEEWEADKHKTFDEFFWAVDVMNAYEEDWDEKREYWKPYFKQVWEEVKMEGLKLTSEEVKVVKKALNCYYSDLYIMELDDKEEKQDLIDAVLDKVQKCYPPPKKKKFFISKPYWNRLEGTIEAHTEEEALKIFDDTNFHELKEEYQGLLSSDDEIETICREQ